MPGADAPDAMAMAGRAQGLAGYLAAVPILRDRGHNPLPPGDMDETTTHLAQVGLDAARTARGMAANATARAVMLVLPDACNLLKKIENNPNMQVSDQPDLRARLSLGWRAALGRP